MTYGQGYYVAVGRFVDILWSTDGERWWGGLFDQRNRTEYYLYSVCYGGDRFVAVGASGRILYSTDAKNWTAARLPEAALSPDLLAVAWANGKFVAVGEDIVAASARIFSSPDGINWSENLFADTGPAPAIRSLNCVAFGSGRWVAFEDGYSRGLVSTDGVNWTRVDKKARGSNELKFIGGRFVAPGESVSYANGILYSTNGTSWSSYPAPEEIDDIAYSSAGRWVALASSGKLYHSTNLSSWTSSGTSIDKGAITFGGGGFAAMGREKSASSADGRTWELQTGDEGYELNGICWHKGNFVVTGNTNVVGRYDWRKRKVTRGVSPVFSNWLDVVSDGNYCVAIDNRGKAILSDDGLEWQDVTPANTRDANHLFHIMGKFCMACYGDTLFLSPDGLTWQRVGYDIGTGDIHSMAEGGGFALGVSVVGDVLRSSDLVIWEKIYKLPSFTPAIAYGNGIWVVAEESDAFHVSRDAGMSWEAVPLATSIPFSRLSFINGRFIAYARSEAFVISSQDGVHWTQEGVGVENASQRLQSIAAGDNRLVIVGANLVSSPTFGDPNGIGVEIRRLPSGEISLYLPVPKTEAGIFDVQRTFGMGWDIVGKDLTPDPQTGHLFSIPPTRESELFRVTWEN